MLSLISNVNIAFPEVHHDLFGVTDQLSLHCFHKENNSMIHETFLRISRKISARRCLVYF